MTLLAGNNLGKAPLFAKGGTIRRESSVDLTIGAIFNEKGDDLGAKCVHKPGEMVLVVSADVLQLPHNVTGFVSCKTSLTHLGVWAITVGIVDPCWVGPVSTTLVNFGANARLIERGTPFLRIAFFEHEAMRKACPATDPNTREREYLSDVLRNSVSFEKTFMDINTIVDRAGQAAFRTVRNSLVVWATILALVVAGLQLFAPMLNRDDPPTNREIGPRLNEIESALAAKNSEPEPEDVPPNSR